MNSNNGENRLRLLVYRVLLAIAQPRERDRVSPLGTNLGTNNLDTKKLTRPCLYKTVRLTR